MKPESQPNTSISSAAQKSTDSPDWNEHEHVSGQVQLQAQKLVHLTGSPELAKYAIGSIEQSESDTQGQSSLPASSTTANRNDEFLKALEDFETSLATPVMSGELIGWVTTVNQKCVRVGELLNGDVQRQHAALYTTITRQDSDLASRVAQLRANDQQLATVDFVNVQCGIQLLLDRAESAEQDESKASLLRAEVVKQALAFVISARTQETAIGTWLSEAFNRDSGSGD